jgi:hypothetical protein
MTPIWWVSEAESHPIEFHEINMRSHSAPLRERLLNDFLV